MRINSFFGDGAEIDMNELREGAATARTVVLLTATPEEALMCLKSRKDLPFPACLAACEGLAEYMARSRDGKKTWSRYRWVDEALRSMMNEAKRRKRA